MFSMHFCVDEEIFTIYLWKTRQNVIPAARHQELRTCSENDGDDVMNDTEDDGPTVSEQVKPLEDDHEESACYHLFLFSRFPCFVCLITLDCSRFKFANMLFPGLASAVKCSAFRSGGGLVVFLLATIRKSEPHSADR